MRHDAIVIGAGPAGSSAALEAARLGLAVLLVDAAPLADAGAIAETALPPALLREWVLTRLAARRFAEAPGAHDAVRPELHALLARQRARVAFHFEEHARRLLAAGVRFAQGCAALRGPGEVELSGGRVERAAIIVIATGSEPRRPARFPFDQRLVCDSDSILRERAHAPRSLVIVGAEVEGCEFACLFAALGTNVTLVERRRRLLRCADPEILAVLHRALQELGVVVALEEEIEELVVAAHAGEPHARLRLSSGRSEVCDALLVLAGRTPRIESLGLGAAGIELDARGFVAVDENFQTSREGVYAVGDVVGPPMRASLGVHQARVAVLHAAGREAAQPSEVPLAVHTIPEIAVVGLIEEALRRLDVPYRVGTARFSELLRSRISGDTPGLLKLAFAAQDRRLLGVQIIASGAAELVHLGAAWLQAGGTADDLAGLVFDQPSLSEAYRLAALDALARLG
jgi:NAD(P) transhydrogenase